MRIAFLAHDGAGDMGGVATWMGDLAPWLRRAGVDARVYGYVRPGETPLFDELERAGVPVTRTDHATATRSLESRATWLSKALRQDGIDVFIPNYFLSGFVAAHWLGPTRPRTVAVLHSDDALYRRVLDELTAGNRFFPADAVVAVSHQLEEMARRALGARLPVARIPYGVPVPTGVAGEPEDELRVVYSGRLEQEQKRILETVAVACDAVAADPAITVDFIGDGSTRDECERLVAARGATASVRFLGRLPASEVRRRLPTYHVFLLLPDYEGLPVALIEAAAAGVVPVCTRIRSGIGEIVEDGVTGLLVNERRDAADALHRLRTDGPLWRRCADAVRVRGRRYQLDVCGAEWIDLMEGLPRSGGTTRRRSAPVARRAPPYMEEFSFDDGHRSPEAGRHAIRTRWEAMKGRWSRW